jgi:two-component system, NtrC family, sensor kinase
VTLFYVAIVRYQFAQIDDLNKSLEAKVRARTRALEQAQTRLVQSEKMGSLGRLVAGIAHEVNNPISAISGMQQTLGTAATRMEEALQDVPEGTAGRARLEKLVGVTADAARVISSGSERIAQVVYRLRRFARLDGADVQDVDISEGIREAVEMVKGQLADDASITVNLPTLPELRCDVRALNQVWLNVLTNAADALPAQGGEIRVTGQVDREEIVISVHDNGRGMSPSELQRALDPGYTTKGVGVGTGLGLPICYQIVEDHGGHIELDSAPGRGTTVSVGLQRARRTDRPVTDVLADAQAGVAS